MGLDDFKKIENIENENKDINEFVFEELNLKNIDYCLTHMDELINCVTSSYYRYINAKIKYDFKKSQYHSTMNWDEENKLREIDGLPKCTNQTQKNAVIDMKCKNSYIKMKSLEMEYKFYNKLFDFISENYTLLITGDSCKNICEKINNEFLEK